MVQKDAKAMRPLSSGPIKSVEMLFEEEREIVFNTTNLWSWRYNTTTMYRMRVPGLALVTMSGHNSTEKKQFKVDRFLLDDTCLTLKEKIDPLAHASLTPLNISAEVHTHHATANFHHILLLLKLRWLLKLHSALCELDHRIVSLKNFITGLHRLSLQHLTSVPCDNNFGTRGLKQELNIIALLDDLIEQLQRSMGQGFGGFVHFVQSCDSRRALCYSTADLCSPKVQSNGHLSEMIDDIFMAHYLKLPPSTNKIIDFFTDLEAFGIQLTNVYPLQLDTIKWWMSSTSEKTKLVREKSAQLQALRAVVSIEMEELGNYAVSDLDAKPELIESAMDPIFKIVGSHNTFPAGFRNRLVECLQTQYTMSEKHSQTLAIMTQMNLDLAKLSADQMNTLQAREIERLHMRAEQLHDPDVTCMLPSLVPMAMRIGFNAEYTVDATLPKDLRPYRSQSVPQLATMEGRDKFRVPLITGPLIYDHKLQTLRTTGYFKQMANLGP